MRRYNEAFGLSNPIHWYSAGADSIGSFLRRLARITGLASRSLIRVSQETIPASHTFQEPDSWQQPTLEMQQTVHHPERYPWTMVHGFYASIGGLAIHISEELPEEDRFAPLGSNEYWSLTNYGLEMLLKRDEARIKIPNLSKEEINSKSKANGLAKSLVCLQALWFIAQCLTRCMYQGVCTTLGSADTGI